MTEAIFVLEGILEMASVLRTMENHLETETNILDLCPCPESVWLHHSGPCC